MKLLAALFIAAYAEARQRPSSLLSAPAAVFRALFLPGERVEAKTKAARLRACRACPLYYPKLETCGSYLRDPELGCGCYMPLKAAVKSNCWLHDKGIDTPQRGWPRHLNSFPNETPADT